MEFEIFYRGQDLTLKEVRYYAGSPAVYYPNDKAHPEEEEEIEFEIYSGCDLLDEILTEDPHHIKEITILALEKYHEISEPYDPEE